MLEGLRKLDSELKEPQTMFDAAKMKKSFRRPMTGYDVIDYMILSFVAGLYISIILGALMFVKVIEPMAEAREGMAACRALASDDMRFVDYNLSSGKCRYVYGIIMIDKTLIYDRFHDDYILVTDFTGS